MNNTHQHRQLRICIVSPYIPKHFGGGERYILSVAEYLSRDHIVTLAIPSASPLSAEAVEQIRTSYEEFLHLDLSGLQLQATPLFTSASAVKKLWWTRQFDVLYYQTDGSIFASLARKNILHIQIPFTHRLSMLDRVKLLNWSVKNTNSFFTKSVIEKHWGIKVGYVHHPFVDQSVFQPGLRKEKIILHVGRFFSGLHTKRQDVLVSTFKKMVRLYPEQMEGWKLVLVGGVEDKEYARSIAQKVGDTPIEIRHEVSQDELQALFRRAKIYWHATGYGEEEYLHPEKMEHFGITTIEAMASGAVPIVINKGGQKEIVEHGVSGFVWNDLDALIEKTLACVTDAVDVKEFSQHAIERSGEFSPEKFYQQLSTMVGIEYNTAVKDNPSVSVVIPNYNGRKLMQAHLPAVLQTMRDGDELILVDDASTDDSVEWLIKKFDLKVVQDRAVVQHVMYRGALQTVEKKITITLLHNLENMRFARSCNAGVENSSHPLVFLLNTDVAPQQDTIQKLVVHFVGNPTIFAVGCYEREKVSGKDIVGGKNELWFERGLFQHRRAKSMTTGTTAWASGGSGMFDARKWRALSGFDERFAPAYLEDVDLSARARARGWQILFAAEARVDHNHETTNSTVFGTQQMQIMSVKNTILFTLIHSSKLQKIQFLLWLPYHLVKTNRQMDGVFVKGLLAVVQQLLPQDW